MEVDELKKIEQVNNIINFVVKRNHFINSMVEKDMKCDRINKYLLTYIKLVSLLIHET